MRRYVKGKGNASIAVEDIGEGQPILFLHGWPFNNRMFEYQYNYFLPRGFRIIGTDLRGFGDSDLVIEDYGYDAFADDVRIIIEELQLQDAILVGFSLGGAVAVRYMARHDGLGIRKLILISAAAPVFPKRAAYLYGLKREEITEMIELAQANRPKMVQEFVKKLFQEKVTAGYRDWLISLAMQASSYGTILSALAMREEDVNPDLARIMVPTLICHGKKDRVAPFEFAGETANLIPQSLLLPFDRSGHAIFHDEGDKLNRMMLKFVQK